MHSACEISWKFGACQGKKHYESLNTYHHKCCQKPGNYTLECNDSGTAGWHGGYIQIGGSPTKYCRDCRTKVQLHKDQGNSKICTTIKLSTKDYGEDGGLGHVKVNKTLISSTLKHTKVMNHTSLSAVSLEEIIL